MLIASTAAKSPSVKISEWPFALLVVGGLDVENDDMRSLSAELGLFISADLEAGRRFV